METINGPHCRDEPYWSLIEFYLNRASLGLLTGGRRSIWSFNSCWRTIPKNYCQVFLDISTTTDVKHPSVIGLYPLSEKLPCST